MAGVELHGNAVIRELVAMTIVANGVIDREIGRATRGPHLSHRQIALPNAGRTSGVCRRGAVAPDFIGEKPRPRRLIFDDWPAHRDVDASRLPYLQRGRQDRPVLVLPRRRYK